MPVKEGQATVNKEAEKYWKQAREAYQRKDWDAAEMFYTKAIKADPKNAKMYVFRGGVRSARAQSINDRKYYLEALAAVLEDYRKAYELAPDDAEVGVSLLEAEICAGRLASALERISALWQRIVDPTWKGLCSWLGAVAYTLADRWDADRAEFVKNLPAAGMAIATTSWNTGDVEKYLVEYAGEDVGEEKARKALDLHKSTRDMANKIILAQQLTQLARSTPRPTQVIRKCYSSAGL